MEPSFSMFRKGHQVILAQSYWREIPIHWASITISLVKYMCYYHSIWRCCVTRLFLSYMCYYPQYLKVLRHPSILKFDGLQNTSDGVWLATEQVTPLESVLEQLSSAEIVAGIYSILEALVFLHDRVSRWGQKLLINDPATPRTLEMFQGLIRALR